MNTTLLHTHIHGCYIDIHVHCMCIHVIGIGSSHNLGRLIKHPTVGPRLLLHDLTRPSNTSFLNNILVHEMIWGHAHYGPTTPSHQFYDNIRDRVYRMCPVQANIYISMHRPPCPKLWGDFSPTVAHSYAYACTVHVRTCTFFS